MDFANVLLKLRTKAKMTSNALGEEAQVDPSYVVRLERGEKRHPSRRVLLKLGQALLDNSGDITLKDVDRLLKAAGYGPLPRNRISIIPANRKR